MVDWNKLHEHVQSLNRRLDTPKPWCPSWRRNVREHIEYIKRVDMRTAETIITLSMSNLNIASMKEGKAEAQRIADNTNRKWIEVYYERNLADPSRHYEPSIPKEITYAEYDRMLDKLDERFRSLLVGI